MVNFVIPVMLDYSANAIIYGETVPDLSFNYGFSDVTGVISVGQIRNTFKYKDTDVDASGPLLKYDTTTGLANTAWHDLLINPPLTVTTPYRNADATPTNDISLGEHVIQWIASTLFGHPLAQAPISNDDAIKATVNDKTTNDYMGKQLYDALTADGAGAATESDGSTNNVVLLSMFEQLVNAGRYTDGSGLDGSGNAEADTAGYVGFPYVEGDRISFLVRIGANCAQHGEQLNTTLADGQTLTGTNTDLGAIFGAGNVPGVSADGNGGVTLSQEVWKFNFILSA